MPACILEAKIADSSIAPNKYLQIIQGEEKEITFIVQADGIFPNEIPESISVKFKDVDDTILTIINEDIERVCEEPDIQIIRVLLLSEETQSLAEGLVRIELNFDDQKAVLTHSMRIIEDIESEES